MSAPPSTKLKPKLFRRGLDAFGTFSIEASSDGRHWEAAIIGLDQKFADDKIARLKKAGAQVVRPAK